MTQPPSTEAPASGRHRQTRRECFLTEMDQVVPWASLVEIIEPHYPKPGRGRRPLGVERMLRVYFLQQWFNLSDPAMEEALYDIPCMRAFAGFEESLERMPDETTILKFRRLLERERLTGAMMNAINTTLEEKGLLLKGGSMVDATLIHAAPSTKNKDKSRDPQMHQTKKGNQWYFGMKIHLGADVNSGLAHTVSVTAANASDISQLPRLLREDDKAVFGDKAYNDRQFKRMARQAGVFWGVSLKATSKHKLTAANERFNCKMSSIRSRVEHLFRIIKRQFGYTKVRYKGLVKNAAQVFTLVGLANLYHKRKALMSG